MSQLTWITPAGSIGSYAEGVPVAFTFQATPSNMSNTLTYVILNGTLPDPTSTLTTFALNSSTGVLTGTAAQVESNTIHTFTIRVTEYNPSLEIVGLLDRTFSIEITGITAPYFTSSGALYSPYLISDFWDPVQVTYANPDPNTTAVIRLVDGQLPPGLEINEQGLIRGYATPPTVGAAPAQVTYNFKLEVTSESGSGQEDFSITVKNYFYPPTPSVPLIEPVIQNTKPPSFVISKNDPNYPFYIDSSGFIGTVYQNNYFIFKILGVDYNGLPVTYNIVSGSLPSGLTLDTNTGYITGTLATNSLVVETYTFSVEAISTDGVDTVTSVIETFSMMVVAEKDPTENIPVDISVSWITNSNLGTIVNGNSSVFTIEASNPDDFLLEYSITSGSLPSDLTLLTTGEIIGKLAFESKTTEIPYGETNTYVFTVQAINPTYPEISSTKEFTLNTYQEFTNDIDSPPVYENIYIKALLSMNDRALLDTLLTNTSIIPNNYLYRPNDVNFGKATNITYQHMYGIPSSLIDDYITAVVKNHYWKYLVLGPIKTAIAKNSNGEIIYEVVYSEIIDDLVKIENGQQVSISKEIFWPWPLGNLSRTLYPNSLPNMREQIAESIPGQVTNSVILPLWMSSQQENGGNLGFTPAWVICYTKPGYSTVVKANIEENWGYKLNEITFQIDRFEVDKSMTFDYNPSTSTWSSLPSGVAIDDSENSYVYFPQKNILG